MCLRHRGRVPIWRKLVPPRPQTAARSTCKVQRTPLTLALPQDTARRRGARTHAADKLLLSAAQNAAAVRIGALTMYLLALVDEMARGMHNAGSLRDAKQLVRLAAARTELGYLLSIDKDLLTVPLLERHPTLDSFWFRDFKKKTLYEVSELEYYESREEYILNIKVRVDTYQKMIDSYEIVRQHTAAQEAFKEEVRASEEAYTENQAKRAADLKEDRKRAREMMEGDQ